MSTYELVIAFLSTNSVVSSTEVTTIQPKKVLLKDVDAEAIATDETEF